MPATPKKPMLLTVLATQRLSPSMQRVQLTGDALQTFPDVGPGAYIKFMFDFDGRAVTSTPASMQEVQLRTYTVRSFERQSMTLTIDMALHGEGENAGPASLWAANTQPGDRIMVGGPGSTKPLACEDRYLVMAGDLTALPAIAGHLELLDNDIQGTVVVIVPSQADAQSLRHPAGVNIIWLSEADGVSTLSDTVAAIDVKSNNIYAWAACEFSDMRALRQLFRQQWELAHDAIYISSYWRSGRSEDQHKIDKRRDQINWEKQEKTASN